MEPIVLNIGLDLGIISPTLFVVMEILALGTTAMTVPLLARLTRKPLCPIPSVVPEGRLK